jgi:hypothetical protein
MLSKIVEKQLNHNNSDQISEENLDFFYDVFDDFNIYEGHAGIDVRGLIGAESTLNYNGTFNENYLVSR